MPQLTTLSWQLSPPNNSHSEKLTAAEAIQKMAAYEQTTCTTEHVVKSEKMTVASHKLSINRTNM